MIGLVPTLHGRFIPRPLVSQAVITNGQWHHVGRRKINLVSRTPRLCCKVCGPVRQPHLTFAEPKKHYTRSLERFVTDICRVMSIRDTAELTGLGTPSRRFIRDTYAKSTDQLTSRKSVTSPSTRPISSRNASTSPLFLIFEPDGSFILARLYPFFGLISTIGKKICYISKIFLDRPMFYMV